MYRYWFFLALLVAGMSLPMGVIGAPQERDTVAIGVREDQRIVVSTDSDEIVEIDVKLSRAANDVVCEHPLSYTGYDVSRDKPADHEFQFPRQGSPSIALYEWHLCFTIGDVLYKAWRGFDPGPGSTLRVECFISTSQLQQKDTDTYLCQLAGVVSNPGLYGEYAAVCEEAGSHCKGFETREDLVLWERVHSDAGLLDDLTYSVLEYDISRTGTSQPLYLTIAGKNPSEEQIERLKHLGLKVLNGSDWKQGKGASYSIGNVIPLSESKVKLQVSTYCGPTCASWNTVILELRDGVWEVTSFELDSISGTTPGEAGSTHFLSVVVPE